MRRHRLSVYNGHQGTVFYDMRADLILFVLFVEKQLMQKKVKGVKQDKIPQIVDIHEIKLH